MALSQAVPMSNIPPHTPRESYPIHLGPKHAALDPGDNQAPALGIEDTEEGELEDGLLNEHYTGRTSRGSTWNSFWRILTSGSRQRASINSIYQDIPEEDNLLQKAKTPAHSSPAKARSFQCYFVVATIGFMMLATIFLFITTPFFSFSDPDRPQFWGQPGTGTEGLSWYPSGLTKDIVPIPCHSHNDYWRKVPLFSAILAGCVGVEADVWLIENELYMGHNIASLSKDRTFRSLYVDPLVKLLEQVNAKTDFFNGTIEGVFDEHPARTLTLLVDLKSGGTETWPVVMEQLQPLRERGWLSFVEDGKVYRRPITVVGSGNAPFDLLTENATYRDTFFDAPLDTMWESADSSKGTAVDLKFSKLNSYYASTSFKSAVGKIVGGELSKKQIDVIKGQIRGAHRRGLEARYWETPEWPLRLRNHVWDILVREGVDLLNVDDVNAASSLVW